MKNILGVLIFMSALFIAPQVGDAKRLVRDDFGNPVGGGLDPDDRTRSGIISDTNDPVTGAKFVKFFGDLPSFLADGEFFEADDEASIEVELDNLSGTETVILAAQATKRFLIMSIEITADGGEAHGSVHWSATVSSTNRLLNFDSADLGGVLSERPKKGPIGDGVFINLRTGLTGGTKVRVLIHYFIITTV